MSESTRSSQSLDNSKAVELTGKIMVVAIIIFFVVVVFVIFLHLYAKWFWWRIEEDEDTLNNETSPTRRRRRRFVFAPGHDPTTIAPVLRRGLEPSVLRSLPAVVYRAEDFSDGLECAVCLSELVDGENARLLPKCNHGFHVDCIDMWFQSHSTCPLCRNSVAPETAANDSAIAEPSPAEVPAELPSFPTNVLFWGNQTRVSSGNACLEEEEGASANAPSSSSASSSNDGALVIDIPIQIPAASASSSSTAIAPSGEDLKSPVTTRLRSLKRLLSRESRVNPCGSNSGSDIEKGNRGLS